jgi:hypothetical protein
VAQDSDGRRPTQVAIGRLQCPRTSGARECDVRRRGRSPGGERRGAEQSAVPSRCRAASPTRSRRTDSLSRWSPFKAMRRPLRGQGHARGCREPLEYAADIAETTTGHLDVVAAEMPFGARSTSRDDVVRARHSVLRSRSGATQVSNRPVRLHASDLGSSLQRRGRTTSRAGTGSERSIPIRHPGVHGRAQADGRWRPPGGPTTLGGI